MSAHHDKLASTLFLKEQRIPLQQSSNSRLHFTYKTRFGIRVTDQPARLQLQTDEISFLSSHVRTYPGLAAGWYPWEREVPPPVLVKPAKQTTPLHRSGLVSQQSPRKHSQAESAFANLIAFQGNTGNCLQQDKSSWWSCQCIMMSHIFSLKHSVFNNR